MFVMRNILGLLGGIAIALCGGVLVQTQGSAAPACDRQSVMRVDSAKLSTEPDGFAIDAFGVSESAGWKSPTLVHVGSAGGVATVDFVGCRPEVSAQVLTPIEAHT